MGRLDPDYKQLADNNIDSTLSEGILGGGGQCCVLISSDLKWATFADEIGVPNYCEWVRLWDPLGRVSLWDQIVIINRSL